MSFGAKLDIKKEKSASGNMSAMDRFKKLDVQGQTETGMRGMVFDKICPNMADICLNMVDINLYFRLSQLLSADTIFQRSNSACCVLILFYPCEYILFN